MKEKLVEILLNSKISGKLILSNTSYPIILSNYDLGKRSEEIFKEIPKHKKNENTIFIEGNLVQKIWNKKGIKSFLKHFWNHLCDADHIISLCIYPGLYISEIEKYLKLTGGKPTYLAMDIGTNDTKYADSMKILEENPDLIQETIPLILPIKNYQKTSEFYTSLFISSIRKNILNKFDVNLEHTLSEFRTVIKNNLPFQQPTDFRSRPTNL